MKKIPYILLVLVLIFGSFTIPTKAADMQSHAGAVTTRASALNVRAQASSQSPVVATLKKGSHITLLSRTGSWWHVEYGKGQYGYCHSDYITPIQGTPTRVNTASGTLNVRTGPGTAYPKTASLYKGETVLVLTTASGWSRILYHGVKTGYVSSQYLSYGQSTYGAVKLSVPSFKQTDSRWAQVQIGTSGKTIAQIGCATTAIAMLESYRTGSTIYPDAMSRQLRYTASGSVYWPSHYTTLTNSSGYLSRIYQLLQQGKPVLFGAKKANGSQHWVVITGFTGGSSLTAAGFTIHDPGSNTRTTLQQFLALYPNFYKYFHY